MLCLINMYQKFILNLKLLYAFPSKINIPSYSKVFLSWYSYFFLFYRSKDSSSVTGVTIIIVAILLAFVLVSVLAFYRRNQCGFKDKVQQCIFGMYRWESLFLKIGIENTYCWNVFLCFHSIFHGIIYIWIFWIVLHAHCNTVITSTCL